MNNPRSLHALRTFLVCLIFAAGNTACCGDIQIPDSVISEPLYLAQSPPRVDDLSNVFPKSFLEHFPADDTKTRLTSDRFMTELWSTSAYAIVNIRVERFPTEEDSTQYFPNACRAYAFQYPERFTYQGSSGNQYCISYIRQSRQDPEGLCVSQKMYSTVAVFQKGQLVLTFHEYSEDTQNSELNEVIAMFANLFNDQANP